MALSLHKSGIVNTALGRIIYLYTLSDALTAIIGRDVLCTFHVVVESLK